MTIQAWLMYLTLVLAATATPGPAVLFITTNAALHGWKKAAFCALGNVAGLFCLGIMAVAGLGTIIGTSKVLFDLVRYAGAGYLLFLGFKLFFQKSPEMPSVRRPEPPSAASGKRFFFQAMGVALSNPKAIVFLTALFPQFLDVGKPLAPQFSALMATLMVFSFSFLMGYALLAHRARIWLDRPGRVKAVNRASGSVFIGFGLLLAVSARN
jgi:threonine/homoserine/homoserine lactone efflux protein